MNPQQQARVIAGYIKTIAAAYGVTPHEMIARKGWRSAATKDALNLLVYHLSCCGMTDAALSEFVHRSECSVRGMVHKGRICLMDSDRELLASLPPFRISDST